MAAISLYVQNSTSPAQNDVDLEPPMLELLRYFPAVLLDLTQGLRTRISRLGALGKLGLPLLYSRAGQESNAFCSIDRQDHTTSSGTSAP